MPSENMNLTRRGMLKRIVAGSAVALVPFNAFAEWAEAAFKADSYSSKNNGNQSGNQE